MLIMVLRISSGGRDKFTTRRDILAAKGGEGKGREGKGREGRGREGKGREGKGMEGKGGIATPLYFPWPPFGNLTYVGVYPGGSGV